MSPEAQADALTAQATSTANLSRTFWVGAVAVRRPGSVGFVSALRSTRPTPPMWTRSFDETPRADHSRTTTGGLRQLALGLGQRDGRVV